MASISTNSTYLAESSPLTEKTPYLSNTQWKISAAVSVERLPTITPALTEMEEKLQNLFQELENEQSLKSDHEMRIIEEMLVFLKYIHLIYIVPRFKKKTY